MAAENFADNWTPKGNAATYFTEDSNTKLSYNDLPRDVTAYYLRNSDYSADDFDIDFEVYIDVDDASGSASLCGLGVGDTDGDINDCTDWVGLLQYGSSSSTSYITAYDQNSGHADYEAISEKTKLYATLTRVGTTINCKLYSDAARTNQTDETEVEGTTDALSKWIIGTRDSGDTNRSLDGYWENLDLQIVASEDRPQVITVIMSKLFIPIFWLRQGKNKRRDFLKNTLLALIGLR